MSRLSRYALALTAALALAAGSADARQQSGRKAKTRTRPKTERTMGDVKKEQTATRKRIEETDRRLKNNDRELNRRMGELRSLNADISASTARVKSIGTRIDSLGGAITGTSDSIAILEGNLKDLRRAYASAMNAIQPSGERLNTMTFFFSASSFSEAWSRLRYLRRFGEWRRRKAEAITEQMDRIAERRIHLTRLRHDQDVMRREAESERRALQTKQDESRKLVASLRREDSRLRSQLAEQQRREQALDRELDRIIAAEQERMAREEAERKRSEAAARNKVAAKKDAPASPATANKGAKTPEPVSPDEAASARAATKTAAATSPSALTGSFAANKGRLLFPVAGKYKVVKPFGRHPHPTLPHVVLDNSGIDIETGVGATARAVFKGTVSAIFRQPGYGAIVMLRHGKYLTVYAGLSSVAVTKGQSVGAGQTLGSVAEGSRPGFGQLHFEVRNEKSKLNPSNWVK
ncbi:MAG: peptidoglycan DD-metalloendopeptidase family protein [Duncaniella sp.]|nr:peptidoglycan DD-metalloendopeptidase family protein [Duncaniella sp.]